MLQKSSIRVDPSIPSIPRAERPPLFDLLLSLIDARVSHIDILETVGPGARGVPARQARHTSGHPRQRPLAAQAGSGRFPEAGAAGADSAATAVS